MELISEGIFGKDFGFDIFEKGQIMMPFSGLAPLKLIFFSKKIKGSLCVYRGMDYGSGKSAMDERAKILFERELLSLSLTNVFRLDIFQYRL